MADIKIDEINPVGSELFLDSESFLNELSNDELNIRGGQRLTINLDIAWSTASIDCGGVGKDEWSTASIGCRGGANLL